MGGCSHTPTANSNSAETGTDDRTGEATPANVAPPRPPGCPAGVPGSPASTCSPFVLVPSAPTAVLQLPASAMTFNPFEAPPRLIAGDFAPRATPTGSAAGELAFSLAFNVDSLLGLTALAAVTRS